MRSHRIRLAAALILTALRNAIRGQPTPLFCSACGERLAATDDAITPHYCPPTKTGER